MKRNIIDQVEFKVRAGNGGRGVVSFRREKYIPKGGPDGGDGGNGGSIYFVANPHVTTLIDFAGKVYFEGPHGDAGRSRKQHGKDAEDIVLDVPVGTVVWEQREPDVENPKLQDEGVIHTQKEEKEVVADLGFEWVKLVDMDKPGMKALIVQGGFGGRGNDAFKSSVNTTPMFSEPGGHGEEKFLRLELKVLADVGFVGLPNAGKSTLLSVLTAARPEIANYPFTTLSPNLGVMEVEGGAYGHAPVQKKQFVLADIPGLIEDAHKGKGLGTDFLRHIERCKSLVYVISPTDEDLAGSIDDLTDSLMKQFEVVRNEVREYGHGVDEKSRLVVVNKTDTLPQEIIEDILKRFGALGEQVIAVSAATTENVPLLKEKIANL